MKLLESVAVTAVFALACGSCKFSMTKAVAESPDPFVRMSEVEQKRQLVLDEIERLGPDHPWAGVYRANAPVQYSLVIAPEAGCVTTLFGCFALRDSNWSPVRVVAGDNGDAPRAVETFGERFVLSADGSNVCMQCEHGDAFWREPFEALPFERAR